MTVIALKYSGETFVIPHVQEIKFDAKVKAIFIKADDWCGPLSAVKFEVLP